MLLQLLLGSSQRVAVHDGPERLSKLGLRRQLAELAFLAGEAVNIGGAGVSLGPRQSAPCGIRTPRC